MKKRLSKIFQENLYWIRKKVQAISVQKLGRLSKVDPATISLIERGLRSPSLDTVEKLAMGLSVDVGELLEEKDIEDGRDKNVDEWN
ncbi:helix-turn-helix domain-containing protein [Rummeliibacillus pycnus]|uniref:helix-turn-helix domain-containing protein n=1 Tax=Rummeliibacillus pycnus TaxID=101070 RepID=UPI000C9AFBD5|nr:helix-turn-helix transcriptional regulator [Rummeliibacillus pycnus]